jgi:hypothetical protein
MRRWVWLVAVALGASGCVHPGAAYVLQLDPAAEYASELERSVARALAGQGWVPASVEKSRVVTEWRDVVGFDDDDYPSPRITVRLLATFERERLVLRLESRAINASCAGVPHPPSDLTLVGCPTDAPNHLFFGSSLEALAKELAFALDTTVIAVDPTATDRPLF